MVLELYVWGPAFSLPSIEPQCLAAIVYLRQVVSRDEWVLIASNDDSVSPTKTLPALRDGSEWIGGFQNIVSHLNARLDRHWDLDSVDFSLTDKADIAGFSAFIEANGQPLLDLSLFVSSENYTATTRAAYSRLLQWPGQWFTSPRKRAIAKARTDHLGLSALDLDAVADEHKKPAIPSASDVVPQSLRVSKQTITSVIEKHQHAARFRLDALADAFFEPLQELLGNKRYMLSEEKTSSLDCLALSYLALALIPPVLHKWLAETMTARYPTLCSYVKRLSEEFFGGPVRVEDALIDSDDETRIDNSQAEEWQDVKKLPWRKAAGKGVRDAVSIFLTGLLDALPLADRLRRDNITFHSANTTSHTSNSTSTSSLQSIIMPSALALGSVAAAIGGYLLYLNSLSEPSPQRTNLSQMGEAGAMLGMGMFGQNTTVPEEGQRTGRVPVGLEVDVEVDETAIR